jgi:hypothetical protein
MTRLFGRGVSAARAVPILVLLTGAIILAGCGHDSVPIRPVPVLEDTSGSWPSAEIEAEAAALAADTVFSDTVLSLFNERHVLTITGVGQGGSNFDRAFRIQLTNKQGMVIDTLLTKHSFADSLDADFLERAGLYALDFDFVRSQSLYFNAFIGVDETDNVQFIDFFLTYAGPKKGRLVYWTRPEELDAIE